MGVIGVEEILKMEPSEAVAKLKEKQVVVPSWEELEKEYDPKLHPVMDKVKYPDLIDEEGKIEEVSRITYDLQRLAVKRMTELCFATPQRRGYSPDSDSKQQKEAADYLERVYQRNRINSLNIERGRMLFASCEVATLWYMIDTKVSHNQYGFPTKYKLRAKNYSPFNGHKLYPLFDYSGDLICFSIETNTKEGGEKVKYFDTYTKDRYLQYRQESSKDWEIVRSKETKLGKIPVVYWRRDMPIWEDNSNFVYETEWVLSRNSNYIRKNSTPILGLFSDEEIPFGEEEERYKNVVNYPRGARLEYITWAQAIESIKFQIQELRQAFFTQLQLPDWSYENMKSVPRSGESMKQMMIDCTLKVMDEAGALEEGLDREMNIVKEFMKIIKRSHAEAFDELQVVCEIIPFQISEERERVQNLTTATGGKPIMSQREAIAELGYSTDPDETLKQIKEEERIDLMEQAF